MWQVDMGQMGGMDGGMRMGQMFMGQPQIGPSAEVEAKVSWLPLLVACCFLLWLPRPATNVAG